MYIYIYIHIYIYMYVCMYVCMYVSYLWRIAVKVLFRCYGVVRCCCCPSLCRVAKRRTQHEKPSSRPMSRWGGTCGTATFRVSSIVFWCYAFVGFACSMFMWSVMYCSRCLLVCVLLCGSVLVDVLYMCCLRAVVFCVGRGDLLQRVVEAVDHGVLRRKYEWHSY